MATGVTLQKERGDRWLRGATGDRRQGDRRRPSRALPPSREAPLGGWEDGRRPPAPAHAEETGLVDMELGARCC